MNVHSASSSPSALESSSLLETARYAPVAGLGYDDIVYHGVLLHSCTVVYATTVEFGSMKSARPSPSVSTQTSGSKSKSSLVSRYPSLSSSVSTESHMLTAVVCPPVPG